jgi:lactoylglutathione lyase
MLKFAYTILYVKDVALTAKFYQEGFDFALKFITPENDYAELISGETTLAFASIPLAKSNLKEGFIESEIDNKPFGIEIGFTTENVEETLKKAQDAGAKLVEAPKTKPWGQTVAYVKDLDGFLLEICTPM